MNILLFLTGILALGGAWLVIDHLLWHFTGYKVAATIKGFDDGLPILSFETAEGKTVEQKASGITHIGYRLVHPREGDIFNAVYREIAEGDMLVRVYGSLYLVAGAASLFPFLAVLAMKYGSAWAMGQLVYVFILFVIVLGGWMGLKFIGRQK